MHSPRVALRKCGIVSSRITPKNILERWQHRKSEAHPEQCPRHGGSERMNGLQIGQESDERSIVRTVVGNAKLQKVVGGDIQPHSIGGYIYGVQRSKSCRQKQ